MVYEHRHPLHKGDRHRHDPVHIGGVPCQRRCRDEAFRVSYIFNDNDLDSCVRNGSAHSVDNSELFPSGRRRAVEGRDETESDGEAEETPTGADADHREGR